jgi:cob(I)alamin adenosyltransferase
MDIETNKPPPKPVEQIKELVKQIDKDLFDIKQDILFIKMKIKEREEKEKIEKLSGGWWLF